MKCTRWNKRGQPCQAPGYYEVDIPSLAFISANSTVVCHIHLSEAVDDAWAEIQAHVEKGNLNIYTDVQVRRTPDAPRIPPLMERLASL